MHDADVVAFSSFILIYPPFYKCAPYIIYLHAMLFLFNLEVDSNTILVEVKTEKPLSDEEITKIVDEFNSRKDGHPLQKNIDLKVHGMTNVGGKLYLITDANDGTLKEINQSTEKLFELAQLIGNGDVKLNSLKSTDKGNLCIYIPYDISFIILLC